MSTTVTCTATLCRHMADGICNEERILLTNAEFRYRDFDRIHGAHTAQGNEQFCRSFTSLDAPAQSAYPADASS